ncbi:uncharacterized protein LOC144746277 [Ciona intestinalis]
MEVEDCDLLFNALRTNDLQTTKQLLNAGANPNRLSIEFGVTPFHMAIGTRSSRCEEFIDLILDHNGDPNVCDSHGLTPLHVAASWGKANLLLKLLQHGANVSLKDVEGKDARQYAEENNSENCKIILDEFEQTPFQFSSPQVSPQRVERWRDNNNSQTDTSCYCFANQQTSKVLPYQSPSKQFYSSPQPARQLADSQLNSPDHEDSFKICMDATSPDNCFTYKTPKKYQIGVCDPTVILYDSHNSSDFSDAISSYTDNSASLPLFTNNEKENVSSSDLSEAKQPNDSFSEFKQKILLASTKWNINTRESDSVKLMKPLRYDNVSDCQESLYSEAESTVPKDCSIWDSKNTSKNKSETLETENMGSPVVSNFSQPLRAVNIQDDAEKLLIQQTYSIANVGEEDTLCVYSDPDGYSFIEHICRSTIKSPNITELSFCTAASADATEMYSWKSFIESDFDELSGHMSLDETLEASLPLEIQQMTDAELKSELISCGVTVGPIAAGRKQYQKQLVLRRQEQRGNHNLKNKSVLSVSGQIISEKTLDTPLPLEIQRMTDAELQSELLSYGITVGPIAAAKKQYQKQLVLCKDGKIDNHCSNVECITPYSQELRRLFISKQLPTFNEDDQTLRLEFDNSNLRLREGNSKDCFNYLLLDPRVTKNLPSRINQLSEVECLKIFSGAIFYVGKGKRSRPYDHFKDAIRAKTNNQSSAKLQHILDIWKNDCGVISLHVFQNVVSEEAHTREAAMIAAIGVPHLTNCVRGKCYGSASKWTLSRLRHYGAFLIVSAMRILLVEGERQIRPTQILSQRKRRGVKS